MWIRDMATVLFLHAYFIYLAIIAGQRRRRTLWATAVNAFSLYECVYICRCSCVYYLHGEYCLSLSKWRVEWTSVSSVPKEDVHKWTIFWRRQHEDNDTHRIPCSIIDPLSSNRSLNLWQQRWTGEHTSSELTFWPSLHSAPAFKSKASIEAFMKKQEVQEVWNQQTAQLTSSFPKEEGKQARSASLQWAETKSNLAV